MPFELILGPTNISSGTAKLGIIIKGKKYKIRTFENFKDKSIDPGWWYLQANEFRSAFEVLANLNHPLINPSVYIFAISLELYLKTFLLIKNVPPDEVVAFKHNLISLRKKCFTFSSEFGNSDLIFIMDKIGNIIMQNGSLKYPQQYGVGLYRQQMSNALGFCEEQIRPLVTE